MKAKVRYLGVFNGASYYGYGLDKMDAYTSIEAARTSLFHRLVDEMDYVTTYAENADSEYVVWEKDEFTRFPATTDQDYIDLYKVIEWEDGALSRAAEPYYRLTMGPRKGVKVEKF
jgi:hypothetical protein